jgi:hypothetical protein
MVTPHLRDGLVAADVNGELLVLDPEGGRVVRLCCDGADGDAVLAALESQGLLAAPDNTGMSRRSALKGAAAAAVVGVTVLALPSAAMAQSALARPTGVTATPLDGAVTVSWTTVANTNYEVEYKQSSLDDSAYQRFPAFGPPVQASPVTVTGLTNGTSYDFRVIAERIPDRSQPSAKVTATPLAPWIVASAPVAEWMSVAYAEPVINSVTTPTFIAVARASEFILPSGPTLPRVMRSSNGITWTGVDASEQNQWHSVAYGNGVWVAVARSGSNRIMRSTDNGLTWSSVAAPNTNQWNAVAYGNGVWVAVAFSGTQPQNSATKQVMRSVDDGVTWSEVEVQVQDAKWLSVAYGNGVWIAISGTYNQQDPSAVDQMMRSTDDGETWTSMKTPVVLAWTSVATNGTGVWVVNGTGDKNLVSSDNGVTWSAVNASGDGGWRGVAYGTPLVANVATPTFVSVANAGPPFGFDFTSRSRNNGATWVGIPAAENRFWESVAFGNGRFVAVSPNTNFAQVMYTSVDP